MAKLQFDEFKRIVSKGKGKEVKSRGGTIQILKEKTKTKELEFVKQQTGIKEAEKLFGKEKPNELVYITHQSGKEKVNELLNILNNRKTKNKFRFRELLLPQLKLEYLKKQKQSEISLLKKLYSSIQRKKEKIKPALIDTQRTTKEFPELQEMQEVHSGALMQIKPPKDIPTFENNLNVKPPIPILPAGVPGVSSGSKKKGSIGSTFLNGWKGIRMPKFIF